jgi:hypothetical protein
MKKTTKLTDGPGYSDKLEADIQISTEEAIAAAIFRAENASPNDFLGEEECADLGRDILKLVLGRFRPDLFTTGGKTTKTVEITEKTAKNLRQYAREFQAMVGCEDFDFNSGGAVGDIEGLCKYILKNVKVPAGSKG